LRKISCNAFCVGDALVQTRRNELEGRADVLVNAFHRDSQLTRSVPLSAMATLDNSIALAVSCRTTTGRRGDCMPPPELLSEMAATPRHHFVSEGGPPLCKQQPFSVRMASRSVNSSAIDARRFCMYAT